MGAFVCKNGFLWAEMSYIYVLGHGSENVNFSKTIQVILMKSRTLMHKTVRKLSANFHVDPTNNVGCATF